jgi:hypothetical protein
VCRLQSSVSLVCLFKPKPSSWISISIEQKQIDWVSDSNPSGSTTVVAWSENHATTVVILNQDFLCLILWIGLLKKEIYQFLESHAYQILKIHAVSSEGA